MRAFHTLIVVLAVTVTVLPAMAGADDPELVFDPPLSVTIRQTNGASARGEIVSMNEKELVLKSVSGKEARIKMERVRTIKTSNETFEYLPAKETFEELCARVDEVPGAKLLGNYPPARTGRRTAPEREADGVDADDRRGGRRAAGPSGNDGGGTVDRGRPGVGSGTPHGRRADEMQAAHQAIERAGPRMASQTLPKSAPVEDAAESPVESPVEHQPGDTIYECSSCHKELPLSFRSGDACPHCGKVAVFEEESAETAAQVSPAPARTNPFAAGGAAPPPVAAPAAAVAPPIDAAAATSPSSGGGGGLADVPLAAKIGIFAGFLVIGWFLLNRR